MDALDAVRAFTPLCPQEEADREVLLRLLAGPADVYTRENRVCHLTASAWTVSPDRTQTLLAWHNIYRSWAWMGGHADGERDLLATALREVREESGVAGARAVSEIPLSLEILTVDGHEKRGLYVPSHLHLNLTWLLVADPAEQLRIKPDENSAVRWFPRAEALSAVTEPWMLARVYRKLDARV